MISVCVVGPWGRMGQRLVRLLTNNSKLRLVSVIVRSKDLDSCRANELSKNCLVTDDADKALSGVDALIDFSAPSHCKERTFPAMLISNTGRLPIRSDKRPQKGKKINCMSENMPIMAPIINPVAPNRSAYKGKMGIIIPKPIKSTMTVKNKTNIGDFFTSSLH